MKGLKDPKKDLDDLNDRLRAGCFWTIDLYNIAETVDSEKTDELMRKAADAIEKLRCKLLAKETELDDLETDMYARESW